MEFKTTTGGTTTLVLDADEEGWLRGVAKQRRERYEAVFAQFEQLRRANPLSQFDDLATMFAEVRGMPPLGVIPMQDPGPEGLDDLIELDGQIRRALKNASSIQVEALLLQARATTLQAIALVQVLRDLDD